MALRITGETEEHFPKHGWGVVGEKLGDARTETLGSVWPLEKREDARTLADSFEASRLDGKSWLVTPVSLIQVEPCEDGRLQASYVEASDLTHPAGKVV